jgi:KamA family protein
MAWKKAIKSGYEQAGDVAELLTLTANEEERLAEIIKQYPMRIPEYYISLIDPNDKDDPIRRMCIPDLAEGQEGGCPDTSGEMENTVLTGMQHKYRQTVMILSTNQCAMYCRHCFRKRMVGITGEETARQLPEIVSYIKAHEEINNVLISGGDSFMNSNGVIREYLESFCDIPHLDFIRFGTRMPVVLPQRITEDEALLSILEEYNQKKQIYIITQFNHPRELTPEAIGAVECLKQTGCIVRNQTVLLKGVNDQAEVLAELMNKLVKIGVVPYYIFQCRPVRGVKNQFQLPLRQSSQIVEKARTQMNGQAKSVRYVMAHITGKITIVGSVGKGTMLFKYHQAKDPKNSSRVFLQEIGPEQGWLGEIPPL